MNDEPYCIWDFDLHSRNKKFIDGIDPDFFKYSIDAHIETEDEKRAAVALRTVLHHATETFFSLIGAYIQAPDCTYAWLAKCSNKELRALVTRITAGDQSIFTKLDINQVCWDSIATSLFNHYMPGTSRQRETIHLFSTFWTLLAHEFTDQNHVDEYNSLKHGFRVRPGGFTLEIGIEKVSGVSPPEEEMQQISQSDYGTTFVKIETVGNLKGNRSVRARDVSINWKIEKIVLLAQLVAMSINNVVSGLKLSSGAEAGTCKFERPQNDEDFERPWEYSPGVTAFNMDYVIGPSMVASLTRKNLLENWRN